MLDGSDQHLMQRTRGRAAVRLAASGLRDLHQSGSAKAILPRTHGATPEVVFLNTAGGLTGGDQMSYALTLEQGARAVATTQTAERAYAASGGVATLDIDLDLDRDATLDWLPQETILFDAAALARTTTARLTGNARLLSIETVVLGRAAMGETLQTLDFTDRRTVFRDAIPVLAEPLRLTTQTLARAKSGTVLGGNRAFCTISLVAQGAEDALNTVRAALTDDTVQAAVSGWDGKLVLRAMAPDAYPLRRSAARILTALRQAPLPRVWQN